MCEPWWWGIWPLGHLVGTWLTEVTLITQDSRGRCLRGERRSEDTPPSRDLPLGLWVPHPQKHGDRPALPFAKRKALDTLPSFLWEWQGTERTGQGAYTENSWDRQDSVGTVHYRMVGGMMRQWGILNRNLWTDLPTKEKKKKNFGRGGGGLLSIYVVNPLSLFCCSDFRRCATKASTLLPLLKHKTLQPKKLILKRL